jgi:molybdopterin-guanine dinucleotide biosynthesis protein A
MRISLHIGAHHTRTPRLVGAMKVGERAFGRLNIATPGPTTYRPIIDQELSRLDGLPPILDEEDAVLAHILGENSTADHLVMINEDWAGDLDMMFRGGQLYTGIGRSVSRVAELFSQHDVHISMAIRNPAFLINAALTTPSIPTSLKWFLDANDPLNLSWVAPVDLLQKAVPNARLTLWCEEDTPLIWPRIIRHIAHVPDDTAIRGVLAAANDVLTPEGMARLRTFLRNHTLTTSQQYERTILAFLDKYADESVMTASCDVPGWTAETVHDLSLNYEEDIATLARRDDVTFLLPETQDALVQAPETA